jgi:DNA-directed RNA polymerase specialized sigma24 family protein
MENFRGESTLTSWLKTACLFYCYNRFKRKEQMPTIEKLPNPTKKDLEGSDGTNDIPDSIGLEFGNLNHADVITLLNMMPNKRYSNIIRLSFLEQKTDKETAEALGITMDNYYNKKILAVKQYNKICRKEEQYGK